MVEFLKFDAHLQSWTIATLPLTPPSPSVEEGPTTTSPRSPELDQSFYADLDPHSQTCTIEYFGGDLAVGKPNACWAGMMSFFLRTGVWREAADVEDEEGEEGGEGHATEGEMEGGALPATIGTVNGVSLRREDGSTIGLRTSVLFDLEWSRLVDCREPYLDSKLEETRSGSKGLGVWKVRGTFEGVWGGEFAFLDFDSYRCVCTLKSLSNPTFSWAPQESLLTSFIIFAQGPAERTGQGHLRRRLRDPGKCVFFNSTSCS